jgi:hypothetical protein
MLQFSQVLIADIRRQGEDLIKAAELLSKPHIASHVNKIILGNKQVSIKTSNKTVKKAGITQVGVTEKVRMLISSGITSQEQIISDLSKYWSEKTVRNSIAYLKNVRKEIVSENGVYFLTGHGKKSSNQLLLHLEQSA